MPVATSWRSQSTSKDRFRPKITRLAEDPAAGDLKPLHGELRGIFRARSGDYRIWFQATDELISILRITNRKDGYD